ncbi:MAG: nitrate reductase cytochrome c-type subunit, partial [Gammaproteobacteria bacterium]|nr:nitrate reductase cytochrome c-type subunit [Gammaproteobacteria bacterium]
AKSVEMSEAHFTDRNGNKLEKPAGGRHFCNQCHVPQVDAPPLVGTTFQSVSK